MTFNSAAWLIPTMVKIQELCQSYTSMTEDKWTAWQREWAVMAVNYVQSHWSQWLISQNLRTFSCLQRTWLRQLAVSLSPAEPRICRFCMCGSLNSACIWLIHEICRQVVFWNCHPEWDQQKLRSHGKQKWSMESCWSCFRVQLHKPLVHDSPRPNTTGWPPLVV